MTHWALLPLVEVCAVSNIRMQTDVLQAALAEARNCPAVW